MAGQNKTKQIQLPLSNFSNFSLGSYNITFPRIPEAPSSSFISSTSPGWPSPLSSWLSRLHSQTIKLRYLWPFSSMRPPPSAVEARRRHRLYSSLLFRGLMKLLPICLCYHARRIGSLLSVPLRSRKATGRTSQGNTLVFTVRDAVHDCNHLTLADLTATLDRYRSSRMPDIRQLRKSSTNCFPPWLAGYTTIKHVSAPLA